jgi:hypothetical protein
MMKRIRTLGLAGAAALMLCMAAPARADITEFDFLKNTITNSTLYITVRTDNGFVYGQYSYRAGSGQNTNACDKADPSRGDYVGGWLPNGWYSITGHYHNYPGSDIQGRVWHFQDHACSNGTMRTELFIHSEETSDQGQYCPTAGDDPFCWEGDFDYMSNGCIKVSRATPYPSDLARLHSNWDSFSGLHGTFTLPMRLNVG